MPVESGISVRVAGARAAPPESPADAIAVAARMPSTNDATAAPPARRFKFVLGFARSGASSDGSSGIVLIVL